jgi:hypothetical protein
MKNEETRTLKEIFKSNKKDMIKIKQGKIIGIDLLDKLKKSEYNLKFDIEIKFTLEESVQKMVMNQGFLLPYKFSKNIEKAKIILFLLLEKKQISNEEANIGFYQLNEFINLEIKHIINKSFTFSKKKFNVETKICDNWKIILN